MIAFWCNGPMKGCSHGLQVDVGTSGRTEDDDALLSDWPGDDAVFAGWYSSRSAITREWSRWTGCSFPYEYHIGRETSRDFPKSLLFGREGWRSGGSQRYRWLWTPRSWPLNGSPRYRRWWTSRGPSSHFTSWETSWHLSGSPRYR